MTSGLVVEQAAKDRATADAINIFFINNSYGQIAAQWQLNGFDCRGVDPSQRL
jgi:hypothetical protein